MVLLAVGHQAQHLQQFPFPGARTPGAIGNAAQHVVHQRFHAAHGIGRPMALV